MNCPDRLINQSGGETVHGATSVAATVAPDQVNILIVDDEPKNLLVLETVLDVRMPGMTGFELAQLIKERKETARVPILFLTAYYTEDQHILEGYDSGAVDYLHKPVNAPVPRSKVAVFVELYRKGRALEIANRALLAEVADRRLAKLRIGERNETLDHRVTERTNALQASEAELRDANRRKDEFLATLAHELRNPLAPLRNALHVMRLKGALTPESKWGYALIDRQVQAMSRLIDEYDQLELDLPQEALYLDADSTRLTQAFMNLLNNAAKYMDRGGGSMSVSGRSKRRLCCGSGTAELACPRIG